MLDTLCFPASRPIPTFPIGHPIRPSWTSVGVFRYPALAISSSHLSWTLLRHSDRGLLCFKHRDCLFQCAALNFGTRVSSFYWARTAGLPLCLLKRLARVHHSGLIYVDDLLSIFNRLSAPLGASVIVLLLLCLRVPMSWHKGFFAPTIVWIGWQMDFTFFPVRLDTAKSRLVTLVKSEHRLPSP